MKNLSNKDILQIVKDIKDTVQSVNNIINGVRDLILVFKR